jgi:hypothetical protein
MKNVLRAAGALSLGAAPMALTHTAVAAEGGDKPWTASASLRGFYDDNIFTANSKALGGAAKIDSFGFDISPSVTYGRTMDTTSFDLGYTYLARWFENRPGSSWDQNHNASVELNHTFSTRAKVNVSDVFVSAQDPAQSADSGLVLRAEGDNISNAASVSFELAATDQIIANASYRNNLFDYDRAVFANSLNRVEHLPALDLSYLFSEATSAALGYQFGIYDFDADRDFNSHIIYAGIRHTFTQSFYGSLNAGVQVTDFDDAGVETSTTPYLDGKLVYQYSPGSDITFNVRHSVNATDVYLEPTGKRLVAANQQTTLFRLAWAHAFTARVKGTLIGQFQNATFNGGTAGGATETYLTLGTALGYAVSPNVTVDVSYFHDTLNSSPLLGYDRGYGRNRLLLGVTARF